METLTRREMYIPKFIHWVEGEHTRSSKQRSEHASYKAMLKPSGFCKEKNKVWVKTKLLQLLAPPPSPIPDKGRRKEWEEREKKRNNVRVYNIWWRKRYLSDLGVKTFLGYTYANNCINQKKKMCRWKSTYLPLPFKSYTTPLPPPNPPCAKCSTLLCICW